VELDGGWPPGLARFPVRPDLDGAACRRPGVDPQWFFPNKHENATLAGKVCAGCPVAGPCLDYALAYGPMLLGTWAGTTPIDRRRLRLSILVHHAGDRHTEPVDHIAMRRAP
jgi:hypothetical protein